MEIKRQIRLARLKRRWNRLAQECITADNILFELIANKMDTIRAKIRALCDEE